MTGRLATTGEGSPPLGLLLLGAGGFVGSAILRELATYPRGAVRARALLRRPGVVGEHPFLEKVEGTLESPPADLAPEEPYALVHFAVKQIDTDGTGYDDVNVRATRGLLASLRRPPAVIVYGSSMSVYGQAAQDGVRETASIVADTPLARSRALAEQEIARFADARGIPAFATRTRFVLGQGDRFVLPNLAKLARRRIGVGNGAQRFSVVDVADYARIVLQLARVTADQTEGRFQPLNVGYARPVSFDEIASALHAPAPRLRIPVSRAITGALRSVGGDALATRLELVGLAHWGDVSALTRIVGGAIPLQDPLPILARAASLLASTAHPNPALTVPS